MPVNRQNILWITLDSVRADHTSLHNYRRETTPELNRIAESPQGNNFKHGIAHSTRTPVSVPSMLTGLYPSTHRMLGTKSGNQLPESMTTVPELLSDCGYQTIAVSENGYAGEAKGIDERFDYFTRPTHIKKDIIKHFSTLLRYSLNIYSHGPGLSLSMSEHSKNKAFFTTDITKRKLKAAKKSEPFFCYVHYNEPHHAYNPPVSYRDEYTDKINVSPQEAVSFAEQMSEELYEWMAEGLNISDNEWEMLYAMYDAVINYTDACVGELFNFVQRHFDDTIIVITSDHGDLFGEYGLLGHHIVLHDGLIHVPMVTHGLNDVEYHTEKPTQHIDIMQTILSTVGADTSQFQGYDLREESREIAISQDLRGTVDDDDSQDYERIRQYNPNIDLSHLPQSLITAVRTTEYKLIQTKEWSKLYQLPNEEKDVKHNNQSIYENLMGLYDDWLVNTEEKFEAMPEEADLSKETQQHLRDMGYIE